MSIFTSIIVIYQAINEYVTISKSAQERGCEYLGRAKDLSQVEFYACDHKIVMKRTGDQSPIN